MNRFFRDSCLLLLISMAFFACNTENNTRNIKDYYFPIDQLETGMVYEYHPVNVDTFPIEYWYYRTQKTDSATYFTANYYDQQFVVRQFSNEEVVENGTLLHSHFLYEFDSTGLQRQIPSKILSPSSFPFEVRDSGGIFLMKVKWIYQEEPPITTTLIRNRKYAGSTKYTYGGKEYDCVVFELKELVDNFDNGHLEREFKGMEIYAKGLGLVYYKKEIDTNFVLEYALKDTFSMQELESRYRNTLGMNDF